MPPVITEKSYRFTPPHEGRFWPVVLQSLLPWYLNRFHGVEAIECRGAERLRASLAAGHGVLLAPNHCRPCDPFVLGMLIPEIHRPLFMMASAHLFLAGGTTAWVLPRIGAFSVYREGLDREALKKAIEILEQARRPLVVFPEGVITRTNDRLNHLMDGVAFMARSAAKTRTVVIHPVAIRYSFLGDLTATLTPVLDTIERRLSWQPQSTLPLRERVVKVGYALLELKEIEYLGAAQSGTVADRLARLCDQLLIPLEREWFAGKREGDVVVRVKLLRKAMLPDLVEGDLPEIERARRWRQLNVLELAQQIHFFPPDYLGDAPTPERLLETVERYEEGLAGDATVHRPLHAVIKVCEAVPVSPKRDRNAETDSVMEQVRHQLENALRHD
jgi:1-acyl-sn-glycerol-3-phosphate acyltransferase